MLFQFSCRIALLVRTSSKLIPGAKSKSARANKISPVKEGLLVVKLHKQGRQKEMELM